MTEDNEEEDDDSDIFPEFAYFKNWFNSKEQQSRFHCAQFNEEQVAYSAFLQGMKYATSLLKLKLGE
jgi:hypothetical protein